MTATEPAAGAQAPADAAPPAEEPAPAERQLVPLEEPVPLSESILWRLHDRYFESAGIDAWASGAVPHIVTTGPLLAHSYALIVEGFATDCKAGRFGPVDMGEPLYVVELGAGSGRFGFQFLKAMRPELFAPLRVVYVMSDRVERNVRFWAENGRFDEFIESGTVDFARYAAGIDESIHLERAGVDLAPGRVVNPIAVIANYLFDVLPQDLFAVLGDELHEELVSAHGDEGTPESSYEYLLGVRIRLTHREPGAGRYGDYRDQLLEDAAAERAGSRRRFLFPARAIEAVRGLAELASGRLLVVTGERTQREPVPVDDETGDDLVAPGPALAMGIHGGSISLPVDIRILARAVAPGRASILAPRYAATSLLVAALVFGARGDAPFTRAAYTMAAEDLLPATVHQVVRCALTAVENASLADLLAILRLARFDPRVFERCRERLERLLPEAGSGAMDATIAVLQAVYELDYPLTDGADLAGDIGMCLVRAHRYDDALWFFERANTEGEPNAAKYASMAICQAYRGGKEREPAVAAEALASAIGALDRVFALAPSDSAVKELLPSYDSLRRMYEQLKSAGSAPAASPT